MKEPDLCYFEFTKMTSHVLPKLTENTRLRIALSIQNLTLLVALFTASL